MTPAEKQKAIAEQERLHGDKGDAELLIAARDAFDEAAQLVQQGLSQSDLKGRVNSAYKLAVSGCAALETFARRMKRQHEERERSS